MWLVIRKSDGRGVGTQREIDPTPHWNSKLFDVKEWHGEGVCFAEDGTFCDPTNGLKPDDPRLGNETARLKARIEALETKVATLEAKATK